MWLVVVSEVNVGQRYAVQSPIERSFHCVFFFFTWFMSRIGFYVSPDLSESPQFLVFRIVLPVLPCDFSANRCSQFALQIRSERPQARDPHLRRPSASGRRGDGGRV